MIYSTISVILYSINTFENFLTWVVYINTLQSPCIAWEAMKSRSKFLRNLVTAVNFTDRNWINPCIKEVSTMRNQFMQLLNLLNNKTMKTIAFENNSFRWSIYPYQKLISQNHKSQAAADRCSIEKLFRNAFVLQNNC